jgi:hypothetical protein
MNMQKLNQLYNTSLVLNNRGVQLLEMQSYRDAITAFKVAFSSIKLTISNNVPTTNDEYDNCISKALNDTSIKLSQLKESMQSNIKVKNPLVVLTDDRSLNVDLIETSLSISRQHSKTIIIRIDDMDGHCHIDHSSLPLESATILFNLATAYLAYTSQYKSKRKKEKGRERAYSMYSAAMSILLEVDASNYEETQHVRLLLFKMIFLQGILQVSMFRGRSTKIRKYYRHLIDLYTVLTVPDVLYYFNNEETSKQSLLNPAA